MNNEQFLSSGWNVLTDEEFKERFTEVFGKVANTIGPSFASPNI